MKLSPSAWIGLVMLAVYLVAGIFGIDVLGYAVMSNHLHMIVEALDQEALSRGLILLTCGVYGNVIRFLPPLTVPDAVFDEALDILEASIRAARGPGRHKAPQDGELMAGAQEA